MKILILVSILLVLSCRLSPTRIAGDFELDQAKQKLLIGDAENKLIKQAFTDIDFTRIRDTHVHLVGVGHNHSGIELNPAHKSIFNFKSWVRYKLFLNASGVKESGHMDQSYIDRLTGLIRSGGLKYKHHVLAFDRHYNIKGEKVPSHTDMYIPNQYAYDMSKKHSDIFEPVISVHPYRKDAVEEVNKWGAKGVKFMKWLPNAMGMDPSHESLDEFYKAVKKWDITILSHVGLEKSVEAEDNQNLGNPLLLRKPLNMGVKIIMAHCASIGEFEDFDNKGEKTAGHLLVFRMLNNPAYKKLLKIDMSATITGDRLDRAILMMLNASDEIQSMFVYGSDYPVPAVNMFIPLKKLYRNGLITEEQIKPLRNLYKSNPMLFAFVLYRLVKHPKTGKKFTPEAFYFD